MKKFIYCYNLEGIEMSAAPSLKIARRLNSNHHLSVLCSCPMLALTNKRRQNCVLHFTPRCKVAVTSDNNNNSNEDNADNDSSSSHHYTISNLSLFLHPFPHPPHLYLISPGLAFSKSLSPSNKVLNVPAYLPK